MLDTFTTTVKAAQARHLVSIMNKNFRFFKTAFISLIDKILVIEQKDQLIKNVYTLIAKFFQELFKVQAQLNPSKINHSLTSSL